MTPEQIHSKLKHIFAILNRSKPSLERWKAKKATWMGAGSQLPTRKEWEEYGFTDLPDDICRK